MSAGHKKHGHGISREALEQALSNAAVEAALQEPFTINSSFDIPYLAGYSKDGKTRYLDRHLPHSLEINGKSVDVTPFLVGDDQAKDPIARGGHEGIEKACEQLPDHPEYLARHEIATAGERRLVTQAGINWNAYSTALKPYIKADEKERIQSIPPNLDMTPYTEDGENKALVKHMRDCMSNETQPQN